MKAQCMIRNTGTKSKKKEDRQYVANTKDLRNILAPFPFQNYDLVPLHTDSLRSEQNTPFD
jgi:hypothetical protein